MKFPAARAAAAATIAGLLGAASAALFYAWKPALVVECDRDLPARTAAGIYSAERDEATGTTFAWTGADAVLRLPGLDRAAIWTLDLRVRGARAAAERNPMLAIVADGVAVATEQTAADWTDVRVTLPPHPDRRGLTLNLHSSATFVPGNGDPRALGVMIDRLSLSPDTIVLVPRPAVVATATTSAVLAAALALLGVTAGSAIGGAVLLSVGTGALTARGFGPFTDYPGTVTALGCWIGVAFIAAALAREYRTRQPLRNTARFAAAFAVSALFLKLLVLLHPNMPIGDAMFHAHRFQGVLGGNLFFTSIAPGGYAFPYPPGLYVFTAAFSSLVRRGAGDAALLRIVTCSLDAAVSVLLYWVMAASWRNRLAAAIAVAVYHLVPVDFAVLTTGNLTNAFAQSIAVVALALIGNERVSIAHRGWWAVLTLVLVIAFLSHTSTVAILFVAAAAAAVLLIVRGDRASRSEAFAIASAAAVAALLAVGLYYARFLDTYRAEFARIGRETAANAADAGGRTVVDRLRSVPYATTLNLTIAVVALAAAGAWLRAGLRDRLTLAVFGWLISCALFLALGILTPIDMRYYLAAVPALAMLSGYSAAWLWNESPRRGRPAARAAAGLALAAIVASGIRHWWGTLS